MKHIIFSIIIAFSFSGCIVGAVVSAPFKITGAVLDVVAPDPVGDTVSGAGDAIDTAIPF